MLDWVYHYSSTVDIQQSKQTREASHMTGVDRYDDFTSSNDKLTSVYSKEQDTKYRYFVCCALQPLRDTLGASK